MTDQMNPVTPPPLVPEPAAQQPGNQPVEPQAPHQGRLVAGAILILVGALALIAQIPGVATGLLFLPGLALIFLVAGYLNRQVGLLIPGGILMGIGVGGLLTDGIRLGGESEGGLFMLAFGAGWCLITLLAFLIGKRLVWPLYPGGILAAFGLSLLIGSLVGMNSGLLVLPGMGIAFLAAGLITRKIGLLIPGGILTGIGVGTILMESTFKYLEDPARPGVFLLAFAGGWVLISLTALLIQCRIWWPLIPGAVLGLVGAALLAGQQGLEVLRLAGYGWPVILIVVGLYLLLRRRNIE